jgi:4-amino-4-deoxy-L-arabinose transferase-like glycosyltransferase
MAVTAWSSEAAPQASESKLTLSKPHWHQHLAVMMPILTLYFGLAFYRIDHQSLWSDEVLSLRRADPDRAFLVRKWWSSGHGPLYFRLLHLWARWGTSELALRALSTLLGGVTVCLAYTMGLQLLNRQVAGIGAMLLATSPFLIWYSQEARYVMLMMAAALFAMYTFHRALTARQPGWWLLHCCSLVLAIAAFVGNVLLPLVQGLYLLSSPSRHAALRKWLVCQLLVFALFAWWANDGYVNRLGGYWQKLALQVATIDEGLAAVPARERLATGGAKELTVMALPYTFFTFSAGFSLGPSVRELHASRSLLTLRPHALSIAVCGLLFGSLLIVGLAALRRQPDTAKLLTVWLAVPIVGTLGITALIPSLAYNVRYVAMSFPAYILILSAAIAGFRRPFMRIALLAAVLAVNGVSLAHYYLDPRYGREDTRAAARYLEMTAHPGDALVVVGSAIALSHYYRGSLPIVNWRGEVIKDRPALTNRLQQLSEAHDHLWLVSIRPWEGDPKGTVRGMLDDRYSLIGHKELPGVDIYTYRLR